MTNFHLVASHSAAGSLRVAVRELGLPGKVFCIMDALELGPLSDGRERVAFWRSLVAPGYSDELPSQEWDAPWRELRGSIAVEKPQRLLIWVSESGADYVLLRMACHWLAEEEVALWPALTATVRCRKMSRMPRGWRCHDIDCRGAMH